MTEILSLEQSRAILIPGQARSLSALGEKIRTLENLHQKRETQTGEKLSENDRKEVLVYMMPGRGQAELRSRLGGVLAYKTYEEFRAHLLLDDL